MKKTIAVTLSWALPAVALAQSIQTALARFNEILQLLVPILIGVAVLWFFWGIIVYLSGGAEEKEKGKNIMIFGVIALFVMVSIFGIINLLGTTFSITPGGTVQAPRLPR